MEDEWKAQIKRWGIGINITNATKDELEEYI